MSDGAAGKVIAVFESRLSEEMAGLARRHGLDPRAAPALEELPLDAQDEARAFGAILLGGGCDVLVLLTGVGATRLVEAMTLDHPRDAVVEAMRACTRVCRGPKPAAALKALGLAPDVVAPEPNTHRELLAAIDASISLAGKRVYVQEYGLRNEALLGELAARGAASVVPVPVYGYGLPKDTSALAAALDALAARTIDAALFTSQMQVVHLFEVARGRGREAELRDALAAHTLLASIGPITTEALARYGLAADFEPEHPKMGHLVVGLARTFDARIAAKRAGTAPAPPAGAPRREPT